MPRNSTQKQPSQRPGIEKILAPIIDGLPDETTVLEQLLDIAPVGAIILDINRNILFLNQAAQGMTGYAREEVTGLPCMHVIRSGLCDRKCPLLDLNPDSVAIKAETDIINRLRQKISVRVTSAPLTNSLGDMIGYVEFIEDIQILKKLDKQFGVDQNFEGIIGQSPEMQKIFDTLPVIARNESSVLITGETGTGKDLIAEAIHNASERAGGSFIKVNCGALPETLLESELFGHVKGAFTGAVENKPGRFKIAHNGTLYLTEIGDLPLHSQVKLLTFLDDQVIYPVGSVKGNRVNVRVIAGTHRDLELMARQGQFREDLLFRLNVVRIRLPALRERNDDITLLADHFLATMSQRLKRKIQGFTSEALSCLQNYDYPGNVRELRNIIEFAANVCAGSKISLNDLPIYITQARPKVNDNRIGGDSDSAIETAAQRPALSPSAEDNKDRTWVDVERRLIMDALIKAGGKKQQAAELLGWGRSTLWRKMKKHGMDDDV
jgi:PAS domain S-box-containing protein